MTKEKVSVSVGKKKKATARAMITKGTGSIRINAVPLARWGTPVGRNIVQEPFYAVGELQKTTDINVEVSGGGVISQACAARVAIARSITDYFKQENLRQMLLAYDNKILSGDARQREPNKPNDSAPRAKRQKSYR